MPRFRAMAAAVAFFSTLSLTAAAEEEVTYRHVLDGSPLDIPTEGPNLSDTAERFHDTGDNPYVGDPEALAEGQEIYSQYCAACHMPDGSGRIGPSFLDDVWHYESTATMRGRFAIVYAGGAGAMQSFSDRLSQDQILKVLAYIEKLRGEANPQ